MPGLRIERSHTQTIHATPARVFPLLCPEMEKRWIPGWDARMLYSRSGVAEAGAVFATPHSCSETLWLCTLYLPDREIRYARWQPDGLVVEIEIGLTLRGADTAVAIRYCWTSVNEAGDAALQALTEQAWADMMTQWESAMNTWLAAH